MHTQIKPQVSVPSVPKSASLQLLGTPQQDARTTDRLLTSGAFGALAFVVVLFVEGATRPGYNAWFRFGSELSLSDQGWMQIANFIMCGLLVILGAVGLRRALQTGPGSTFGPILVGVFGLSLVSAGVFVMDPRPGYPVDVVQSVPTLHSILHGLSGMVCFGSLAAAALVLARRFNDSSRIWMPYSILTGILVAASFVAAAASSNVTDSPTGLWQRIGIVAGWGWLAVLTLRLRSRHPSSSALDADEASDGVERDR